MFDRTYIAPHPGHVSVEIIERRAPTDESVRMLRDMEQAAEKSIINAVKIGGNGFECVLHKTYDCLTGGHMFRAVFVLNGKRMTAEAACNPLDESEYDAIIRLRDAIAGKVAAEMLTHALKCAELRRRQPE